MRFIANMPIYIQIAEDIKHSIISGKLKAGDKLPSVREYCKQYNVTSLTMQRAMGQLEKEGITEAQKGVGSFIRATVEDKLANDESRRLAQTYIAGMKNMGFGSDEILEVIREELQHENNT